jgi:hypothetical protein
MTALTLNSLTRSLGISPRGRGAHVNTPAIVAAGLIAEWRFDDGAGQVLTDYSGNGRHGQLGTTAGADVNDPAWTAQGLSFDGVNDQVVVSDFAGPSAFHLDLVVRPASTTQAYSCLYIAHGIGDLDAILQIFREVANNRLWYFVRTSSGSQYFTGSINVFDNAHHLIQISRSTGQFVAHVDGDVDVPLQSTAGAVPSSNGPIWFGARGEFGGSLFMQGEEAWAAWYSAGFDDSQRAQNEEFARYLMAGRGVTLP